MIQRFNFALNEQVTYFLVDEYIYDNELFALIPMDVMPRVRFFMKPVWFDAAEFMIDHHHPGSELFVITSGQITEINTKNEAITLGPGSIVGETVCFRGQESDPEKMVHSVVAVTGVQVRVVRARVCMYV